MRVDLTPSSVAPSDSTQVRKPAGAGETAPAEHVSTLDEDKVDLSLDSESMASLQAKALSMPEIRSDKVHALREAIATGQYQVEPAKIAEAIASESRLKE